MTRAVVVGAGMAGLLSAAMLRGDCEAIFEREPQLPSNHSAVLRFRSSVVGDVLNIPFKRVSAIKAVDPWRNPVADALAYSRKTNGTATLRSVLSADGKASDRFIAPTDLVARMAEKVIPPISVGIDFSEALEYALRRGGMPVISTIPMPALMEQLAWPRRKDVEFRSVPGVNVRARLRGVEAYCSVYVPDPEVEPARVTITGDELIAEVYGQTFVDPELVLQDALNVLGLDEPDYVTTSDVEVKPQRYAKILPIDENERRAFIMWATREHGVYSLGRYATWRPGLLLDDVVNDVRVIARLINHPGEAYAHQLKG